MPTSNPTIPTIPFSIAQSELAFHALTTGLYQDRLRAPVREIISNAIDVHNRIQSTTPIEIKIPNPLDSEFSIRDFGTGLSKKDMLDLYTNLFSSDKHLKRTNEVGGFGVGAKSPFAYTDSFTVESFYHGEHTIYTAYIDGFNTPKLLTLLTESTTQPNGLKVSYPVDKKDVSTLLSIVNQELQTCNYPVTVLGQLSNQKAPIEKDPSYINIGPAWLGPALARDITEQAQRRIVLRMGSVVYPVPTTLPTILQSRLNIIDSVMRNIDDTSYSRRESSGSEIRRNWQHLVLDLPIGSATPAMSREQLVWSAPNTVDAVMDATNILLTSWLKMASTDSNLQAALRKATVTRKTDLIPVVESKAAQGKNKDASVSLTTTQFLEAYADWTQKWKATVKADAIWKKNSYVMHPGFVDILTDNRDRPNTRHGFRPSKYDMVQEVWHSVMPLYDDYYDKKGTGRVDAHEDYEEENDRYQYMLDDCDHIIITLPSAQAHNIEHMYGHGSKSMYDYSHKKNSLRIRNESPSTLQKDVTEWLNYIKHIELEKLSNEPPSQRWGRGYGMSSAPILVFAQSEEHLEQLKVRASAQNKTLSVIDMDNDHITVIKPQVQATAETSPPNETALVTVQSFDTTTGNIVTAHREPSEIVDWMDTGRGLMARAKPLSDYLKESGRTLYMVNTPKDVKALQGGGDPAQSLSDSLTQFLIQQSDYILPATKQDLYIQLATETTSYGRTLSLMLDTQGAFGSITSELRKTLETNYSRTLKNMEALPDGPCMKYPLLSAIPFEPGLLRDTHFIKSLKQYISTIDANPEMSIPTLSP